MPEVAWYKKTEGRSVWPDHPKWSHLCLVSWREAAAVVMGKLLLVAFCLVALAASMSSLTKKEEEEGESYLVEGGLARQARDAEPKKNRGRTKKQRRKKKSNMKKVKGGTKSGRSSSCRLTSTCLSKAHDAMKLIKMVTNFKKQHKAAHAKSSQGTKKKGKTMDYHRSLLRLKEAAGGDMSAPVCNGNTTNDGAKAMGDLYAILSNCSANIEHVCHEDKFETHFNKTQADICKNATDLYEDITKECTGKAGAEACSCWDNHEGQTNSTVMIIKSDECKIKDASDNVKSALSLCKKAVGDCKKAAENVTSVIHDCENPTVSVVDLTAQAAAANATKEAAAAAIAAATETKAQAEAASTGLDSINTANFVPSSARRAVRGRRSVSTCDEVKTALVNIALALDASNTSTYNVSDALVIVNILVVTTSSSLDPACTSDDVADLDAKKTSASTLATQVVVTQEALIVEETAKYNAAVELLVEINTALAEQGESTVDPGTLAPTVTVVAMTTGAPMMTSAGTGATDSSDPSGESPVPMESSMAGSGSVPMESTPMGSPSMASNPMGSTMGSGMTGDMGSTMDFTMGYGMTGISGMTDMTGMSGMTQDMNSVSTGSTGMGSTPTGPTPTGPTPTGPTATGPTGTGPTGTGPTVTAFGSTLTGSIATGSTVAMSTAAVTATT